MAKNTRILTNIAFKKLANATITNPGNSEFQETIKTNVQLGANTIFANTPPASGLPTTLYDTSSDGYVQYVELDLVAIGSSNYDADTFSGDSSNYDDVDSGQGVIDHAYAAKLPAGYETQDGSNSDSTSQNPKAGTGYFVNSGFLSGSGGSVQIVPPSFGLGYIPVIEDSNSGNPSLGGDAQDFYIDYYSGVVFRQDDDPNSYYPVKLKCYIYISDFVTDALQNAGDTVDLHISASDGNGFSIANTATASFESGSAGITVTAGGTNKITIGASTDNVTFNQITASIINADTIEVSEFIVSSSVTYMTQSFSSGSTIFGDTNDDTHQFTGSLYVLHTGSDYGFQMSGSNFLIDYGDSGSVTLGEYNVGAEVGGFLPITGSGLIISQSFTDEATHHNMVKIGETELVDISGSTVSDSFLINVRKKSLVISSSDLSSPVAEIANASHKLYNGSIAAIEVSSTTNTITNNDITLTAGNTLNFKPSGIEDDGSNTNGKYILISQADPTSSPSEFKALQANNSFSVFGGAVTASAVSSSGLLYASASDAGSGGSIYQVALLDTASGLFYTTASSAIQGDTTDIEADITLLQASASAGIYLWTGSAVGASVSLTETASWNALGDGLTVDFDESTNAFTYTITPFDVVNSAGTAISGAIDAATGSLLNTYTFLSSSQQIATDISGAIDAATGSLLNTYTFLSSSQQIATDISGAIGAATASLSASIVGTANEVEVVGTLGGNITIGLPDNVIIAGNLTVQGTTTTIDTDNLLVEDSFIHLASGSGTAGNGGIIIERATDNTGTALFWDETNDVWAVDLAGASAPNNTATTDASVVFVSHSSANPSGTPLMGTGDWQLGQMYIATTDNDNDGNNIWIYA